MRLSTGGKMGTSVSIGDELRGHLGGEGVDDRSVGGDAVARSADVVAHAVVDVEPDQLVGHVGAGGGVHRVADRAVRLAQDLALPDPIDVVLAVGDGEADGEAVVLLLDGEVGDLAGDGVPVAIADGDVDALRDLGAAEAHIAQVATDEPSGDGTGTEEARLQRRLVATVPPLVWGDWRGCAHCGMQLLSLQAAIGSQFSGGCEQLGYRPDPVR